LLGFSAYIVTHFHLIIVILTEYMFLRSQSISLKFEPLILRLLTAALFQHKVVSLLISHHTSI